MKPEAPVTKHFIKAVPNANLRPLPAEVPTNNSGAA
jgi:hypothetical protein